MKVLEFPIWVRSSIGQAVRLGGFVGLCVWSIGGTVASTARLGGAVSFLAVILIALGQSRSRFRYRIEDSYVWLLVHLSLVAMCWVLFVSFQSSSVRLAIIIFGICLAVVLGASRHVRSDLFESPENRFSQDEIARCAPVLAGIVCLSVRSLLPLLPLSFALLAIVLLGPHRRFRGGFVVSILLLIGGSFVTRLWFLREPYWFFVSYDQQFRASLATGLTRWGYTDLNVATGTRLHYHWLAEALAGVLSRIGAVDEFFATTRILPVLLFIGFFLAAHRLLALLGILGKSALVGQIVGGLTLLETDPLSIGTSLGVLLTLVLVVEYLETEVSLWFVLRLCVISGLLLMSQTPFGLVTVLAIALSASVRSLGRNSPQRLVLLLPLGLATLLLLLRSTTLAPGPSLETSGSFGIGNILKFGGFNVPFGLDPSSSSWLLRANSIAHLFEILSFSVPAFAFLLRLRPRGQGSQRTEVVLFSSLMAAGLATVNLLDLGFAQGKLLSPVVLVFTTFGVSSAALIVYRSTGAIGGLAALTVGILLSFVYRQIREMQPDSTAAILSVIAVATMLLASAIIARSYFDRSPDVRFFGHSRARKSLYLLLVVSVAIAVGRQERPTLLLSRPAIPDEVMVGTRDLRHCLGWLRENTASSAVIATDFFDPSELPGSGKSSLVSLVSKRRVTIDSLYVTRMDEEMVRERLQWVANPQLSSIPINFLVITPATFYETTNSALQSMVVKTQRTTCLVVENTKSTATGEME